MGKDQRSEANLQPLIRDQYRGGRLIRQSLLRKPPKVGGEKECMTSERARVIEGLTGLKDRDIADQGERACAGVEARRSYMPRKF